MLAPRKILWSTPDAAIDVIHTVLKLNHSDTVVDLGCGDGRVLLRWAELYSRSMKMPPTSEAFACDERVAEYKAQEVTGPTFVGIDIDPERITSAERALADAVEIHCIDASVTVKFYCANAIDCLHLWRDVATILYVYLTPRGMRKLGLLLQDRDRNARVVQSRIGNSPLSTTSHLTIVSYMNTLSNAQLIQRERIAVPHQPDTAWPLYFYKAP